MAQHNITLNQEEILELLQDSRPDAFKNLLQESLNGVYFRRNRGAAPTHLLFFLIDQNFWGIKEGQALYLLPLPIDESRMQQR